MSENLNVLSSFTNTLILPNPTFFDLKFMFINFIVNKILDFTKNVLLYNYHLQIFFVYIYRLGTVYIQIKLYKYFIL